MTHAARELTENEVALADAGYCPSCKSPFLINTGRDVLEAINLGWIVVYEDYYEIPSGTPDHVAVALRHIKDHVISALNTIDRGGAYRACCSCGAGFSDTRKAKPVRRTH